jgi:hypothetical protein
LRAMMSGTRSNCLSTILPQKSLVTAAKLLLQAVFVRDRLRRLALPARQAAQRSWRSLACRRQTQFASIWSRWNATNPQKDPWETPVGHSRWGPGSQGRGPPAQAWPLPSQTPTRVLVPLFEERTDSGLPLTCQIA